MMRRRASRIASMLMLVPFIAFATSGNESGKKNDDFGGASRVTKTFAQENGVNELNDMNVIFSESFSTSDLNVWPEGWSAVMVVDNGGVWQNWQLSNDARQSDHDLTDAPYAFIDSDRNGSGKDVEAYLQSPVITLQQAASTLITFKNAYKHCSGQSGKVQIALDGSDTWTDVVEYTSHTYEYPTALDISSYIGEATTMQIRFYYTGNYDYWWGIDDVKVQVTDDEITPPELSYYYVPKWIYSNDGCEFRVKASDNVELGAVTALYKRYNGDDESEVLEGEMTLVRDDVYSFIVPADFASEGDKIGFKAKAVDAAGNETSIEYAYSTHFYSVDVRGERQETPYQILDNEYEWVDMADATPFVVERQNELHTLTFSEIGLPDMRWFGTEYSSVIISTDGYVAFEAHESSDASPESEFPSTDTPNGVIFLTHASQKIHQRGSMLWKVVDNTLVISYEDVAHYNINDQPEGEAWYYQAVLCPESGQVALNYKQINVDLPDESVVIEAGYENENGTVGEMIFVTKNPTYPDNHYSVLLTKSIGTISGTIFAEDGTTPLENATVRIFEDGETEVAFEQVTGVDGSYRWAQALTGTYDLEVIATDYTTTRVEDVVVGEFQTITTNVTMQPQGAMTAIAGYVYDADATEENAPLSGIQVYLAETEETVTTDAQGHYSFGEKPIGEYNVHVNSTHESAGYHHSTKTITLVENNEDVNFDLHQILAPRNLQVEAGESAVTLTFDAPLNSVSTLNDLDDVDEILGYRVMLDGEVRETVFDASPVHISHIENYVYHTFKVAADYGYDDDYLVFGDEVSARPLTDDYSVIENDYEWVEIRTNGLGTSAGFTDDSQGTGMVPFGGGHSFTFCGREFDSVNMALNGFVMFGVIEDGSYDQDGRGWDFPSAFEPNGVIGVLWDWMRFHEGDNVWYYLDEETDSFVVTWLIHESDLDRDHQNLLEFQMIMNFEDNTAVFNYKSASIGWPGNPDHSSNGLNDVVVGYENFDGTNGVMYDTFVATETSLKLCPPQFISGTVSGSVVDCEENAMSGVEVYLNDAETLLLTTDATGAFADVEVPIGVYDISFVKDGFMPFVIEDAEVEEDQNLALGQVIMAIPELTVAPTSITLEYDLRTEASVEGSFTVSNTGCGAMDYMITPSIGTGMVTGGNRGPVAGELNELWDELDCFNVFEPIQSPRLFGLVHMSDGFYVGSWGTGRSLYHLDNDGETVLDVFAFGENLEIAAADFGVDPRRGLFYAVGTNNHLYRFSTDLQIVEDVADMGQMCNACTYDWDNNKIYGYGWNESFVCFDLETEELRVLEAPISSSHTQVNSLAYVPTDEDGATIYGIFDCDYENTMNFAEIRRYNPTTDAWTSESIALDDIVFPAGCEATEFYTEGRLDFALLDQTEDARNVHMYEGAEYEGTGLTWMSLSADDGTVNGGEEQTITVTINPADDPNFVYNEGETVRFRLCVEGPYVDEVSVIVELNVIRTQGAEEVDVLPTKYALHQNFPNPFNPSTEIKFDLVEGQDVTLNVYNMLGQKVMTLVDGRMEAGYQKVSFNGASLASGVYFYRLEAEHFTSMKKMILVK